MNNLQIINGRVIDPISGIDGERAILIESGRIVSVKKTNTKVDGARIIDAKGLVVSPGFVDIHTHLREPGFEYKEDITSGVKAAVAGGFTTVCAMPNTNPVNDNASVTEYILKRAKIAGLARVLPIAAISKGLKGEAMADIGDQAEAGAVAISDDGRPVMNSLLLRRAAEYAATFGLAVIDHCEDLNLSAGGVMHEGKISTELGMNGVPSAAEEAHVARDISLAVLTGAHFHITHVSAAGSVELIRAAKKKKINVTCDVTPHHLVLTDEAVRGYDTNFKINPPLRTAADVKELVRGIADGTIDAVATDHAPHGTIDKEVGFDAAASGVVGLETALPVILTLVHARKITLKRAVELLTTGLNVVSDRIASEGFKKGAVADITIFDPNAKNIVRPEKFYSKSRNTPFKNQEFMGKVLYVIVGGNVVFDNEKGISCVS